MKKQVSFILVLSFIFLFVISFVSAITPQDVGEQVKDFYVGLFEPIIGALLGGWDLGSLFLFEKFLIFVLLVAIIFVAIKKVEIIGDNKFVHWIIAIVIPLIGVRFFNIEQIDTIIRSYTWLSIGLTTILPFLIFFFFIYNVGRDSGTLRKILWIIFIGIYIGIWSSSDSGYSTIYGWTLLASIVCLLFDTTIMKRLNHIEMMKGDKTFQNNQLIAINKKIADLEDAYSKGFGDKKLILNEIKELRKHAKWLMKQ